MECGRLQGRMPTGALCRKGILASGFCAVVAAAALAASPTHHVSQKDQVFTPGDLPIKRGDTVEIVNDDGDLLHHLYIDSSKMQYDSGDQEPGAKVDISFPTKGTFDVLCGIHPKMKLIVRVE